ncbi:hypothetical protein AAFF_G00233530 [Aldrovandia affinis]|uniref:Pericentrin/AKAP-450 centrosomal targeting domain-containing protein n=1 Tax=Aldrovandia affinis TaxID=143900 RepID=A0AAD7RF12_9TELE|nr:hypothetical protein AAFF_G00233530 [Aldrovandia affinis]
MEDQERQKKLEAGKAKLAEYRQRKAEADGHKKSKKKKKVAGAHSTGHVQEEEERDQSLGEERTGSGADPPADFTFARTLRSGETVRNDQTYTIEPESEVSTTAEDYTSEVNGHHEMTQNTKESSKDFIWEEDLRVSGSHSEHEAKSLQTRLQIMEDELAAKQQAVEELSRELEDIRAAFGTEGVQQLQEFEAAVNHRDGIITQLTANLQQARKEKDDIMREFLEMTEQSQRLQIQFQQLQAGESLRNSSHSSTAADLLQARAQVTSIQQQVEQRDTQVKTYLEKMDEQLLQINQLQHRLNQSETLGRTQEESFVKKLNEKDALIAEHKGIIAGHESSLTKVKKDLMVLEKSVNDLKEQIAEKNQELESCQNELSSSKQKERMSSNEIQQLMGTVEDLQKRCHKGSQSESEVVQRLEVEMERKMDQLRAELDEMYGQQIVQMKQELRAQHSVEVDRLMEQEKLERKVLQAQSSAYVDQMNALNIKITELRQQVEESLMLKEKVRQELSQASEEKLYLQGQVEDLKQELRSTRGKAERVSQSITHQEQKQGEVQRLQDTIGHLEGQLAAAEEANRDLESKHESEVTNYKIKLEMLEREKDEVLDMMAESQEAELERLRTQMLFSHEEELTKLREDLQRESALNLENLKDEMALKQKQALNNLQEGLQEQLQVTKCEKDSLATEKDALLSEITMLKEALNQSPESSKSRVSVAQPEEHQMEMEGIRERPKEKGAELLKNTKVVEKSEDREGGWGLQSENAKESNKAMTEERMSMLKETGRSRTQETIEALAVENELLKEKQIELKEEIEKQRNTFSFAEKNFEVNYQELKDEFTCLVRIKGELEEQMLKVTADYEVKLRDLQSQIQKLQNCKAEPSKPQKDDGKAGKMVDVIDGSELVEKGTTELMEKLGTVQREKNGLSLRLSEVSEQLMLRESRVEQLEEELRHVKEDKQWISTHNRDLEREREVVTGTVSQERVSIQLPAVLVHGSAPSTGSCSIQDFCQQIELLEGRVSALQSSLQIAEQERNHARQQLTALALEKQTLQAQSQRPVEETPVVSGLQTDRTPVQQSADALRVKHLGLAKQKQQRALVGESVHMELEQKKMDLVAAEQEIQALKERLRMLHTPQPEHDRETQRSATLKQESRNVLDVGEDTEADPETPHMEEQRGIEHIKHEEFQLHKEALRISLSQIYAAQLELQRESLQAEREACLRSQEQELHTSHVHELQQLREKHGQERQDLKGQHSDEDESSSSKYQNVIHMMSEECTQLFLSFAKVLGDHYLEPLQSRECEEQKSLRVCSDVGQEGIEDPASLLHVAKDLHSDLQHLRDRIVEEYGRLQELQSLLRSDCSKMELLQAAYDELKSTSEEEIVSLRLQIDSSASTQDPSGPSGLGGSSWRPEEMDRLKADFQEQQAQLEEQHSQEIKHLRAHYQQQARDTEERYTTELILLQQRLQDLTGCQAPLSLSSESQFPVPSEEESEEYKLEGLELEAELKHPIKSMGLTQQLQTLRRALYNKYLQEVSVLKEQHRAELEHLVEDHSPESRALQREASPSVEKDPDSVGGVWSSEGGEAEGLVQTLERRHRERVEEEIAKVIVQMSVEFAQQTELARIAKQAKETTSAMQTQVDELGGAEDVRLGAQRVEQGFMEEQKRLEKELRERAAEILSLRAQLQLTGACPDDQALYHKETGASRPGSSLKQPKLASQHTKNEEGDSSERSQEKEVKSGTLPPITRQTDLSSPDVITTERNLLRKANESLRQVLSDVLKTTAAAEETIGRHVEGLLVTREQPVQQAAGEPLRPYISKTTGAGGDASPDSYHGSEAGGDDVSVWSGETETDEGLEMSQQLTSGLLTGAELQLENEEYLMNISSRLQAAVEKLLVAITETTNQTQISHIIHKKNGHLLKVVSKISLPTPPYTLEHARVTQTELMRESFRHGEEMEELLMRQEELQERLDEEAKARQQLALELNRAEGLIDGYTGERAALEQQLHEKQELQLHLQQELQVTSSRLQELEQERQQVQQERELLIRQQDAMKDSAESNELRLVEAAVDAAPEADLLEETEKLMKEKVEVQRQAEKDNSDLLKRLKGLEAELEEQVNRVIELEQAQKAESSDLRQQIQAQEKQLEKNRRFLDEQAIDREHERDVFQQEIMKLEHQLKNPQKQQPSNEQSNREVDQLTTQLKEKSDWCSELLLRSEQLQRDVQEGNEEIEKLEVRVRELEQALIINTETLQKVEQKRQHTPAEGTLDTTLEAQLLTEREALERKEKEISNLEEQLEQFREELENKSEEAQQLHMQLEIQRKELSSQQQDLQYKGDLLKVMEEKDREIVLLNEQVSKLQQMETAPDNKVIEEKNELLRELESQVECMKGEQERLKNNSEEEIDQLNDVIEKLQQELSKIEHKTSDEYLQDTEYSSFLARDEVHPSREEFEELNHKMNQTTQELDKLQARHSSLLEKYKCLQERASDTSAEGAKERQLEMQEALQEKTAACVVMQAQVNALEQSAGGRVASLCSRVEELQACVEEKDSELKLCRLRVEQTQGEAATLQHRISELEDKLREKVAAVLVSQAQLGAVKEHSKVQTKEPHSQGSELHGRSVQQGIGGTIAHPGTQTEVKARTDLPMMKVVLLTEKLRELEEGLSDMQKDQELQKQLLSSSEEEVVEYEKRLAVLMNLLNQMTTKPGSQRSMLPMKASVRVSEGDPAAVSELLQEARQEAAAAKEELNNYRERTDKLQEELQVKESTVTQLQKDLQKVPVRVGDEDQLQEVRQEAAAAKEELNSYRERTDKLQELLQEREMTIVQLKEELHRSVQPSVRVGEGDPAAVSQLLQEIRQEAAATKEELNSYRERSDKLQEELQIRDLSIAQLQEELKQVKESVAESEEGLKKKGGKPSGTEQPAVLKGSHQTPQAACTSVEAQAHLGQPRTGLVSEEVAEVISKYTEKIGQMQDLHAAEIMDMETRHISESETLKRETQALQEECRALKEVIQKLSSSGAVSSQPEHLAASQFRDGYTSDSSSDWSQRTGCDPPALHPEFRTTPDGARRDNETDLLPDRIKSLLREVHQEGMQVLSLSELPVGGEGEEEEATTQLKHHGWLKERESLLASVEALKALISKMQLHRETEAPGPSMASSENWRTELLRAVQQVFAAERGVLKSSLYSHLEQLDTSDTLVHLNLLERRLTEQDAQQREAMGILQSADRNSLLMEVSELQAQLQHLQQDPRTPGGPVKHAGPMEVERDHDALHSERMFLNELKAELAQTKLELETTLKAQHKHLKELDTLRTEVTEKAAEMDILNDNLANEQKKSRELQWAFEKEKCQSEKKDEREKEELEDVRLALDEQQRQVAQLSEAVEQERRTSAQLRQQAESGHTQHQAQLSRQQSRVSELQVQLESVEARALELESALERERGCRAQLRQQSTSQTVAETEDGCSQVEEGVRPVEGLLETLQSQLDEKHVRVVQLVGEVERQKLEVVQAKQEWEEERQAVRQGQDALRKVQEQLQQLQARAQELQRQLDGETQQALQLSQERDQLQDRVSQLQGSAKTQQPSTQSSLWRAQGEPSNRTRDWVLQQKISEVDSSAPSLHEVRRASTAPADPKLMDNIINRLQLIATKIESMTSNAANRVPLEEVDTEGLTWLQNSVQSVVSLLQQVPAIPPAPQTTMLPVGGSSNSLTEQLLRQNAELTGFVSRLTEEKNDLRNSLLKLEEELRHHRQSGLGWAKHSSRRAADNQDAVEVLQASDREAWNRERSRLEKCLRQAEAEVSRLKGEIRADSLRDIVGSDADNVALKRMYGKYLRAESFRKALIYQKKYLLLLLGGFQDCEEATLSLIARMGGRSSRSLDTDNQRSRGFTRFRSAVRVSIALSRMRYLVRRWHKSTGAGSSSPSAVNRNGLGQITGNEGRTESPYLHPGSVDVYGEHRGTSRERTGRESPRSSLSAQHRFNTACAETGSLGCSHLQNYDPDRALTDYISRLEALQRRLGSVQSGSSSYAQLHFGIRR